MLTYLDCLGMCDFSQEEINAIAHHEHISGMQAIALAERLIHRRDGAVKLERLLLDELAEAIREGDDQRALSMELLLQRFRHQHASAERKHNA